MTPFQETLRARVTQELARCGIADVKAKVKRVDFEEGEPETQVVLRFAYEGDDYEVWIYADEAAVLEPGDDWWTFDLDEHETPERLTTALLEHLQDLVADD